MSVLDRSKACEGSWHGTNRLHDPHTNAPDNSATTASLTTLAGGRFIRMDYTWAYCGTDQDGSLLIGYESDRAVVTAHWIDSWHMGDGVMSGHGTVDPAGAIDVRGGYAAPPGAAWGWRIVLRAGDDATRQLVMYNVHPDGREELAVEAYLDRGSGRRPV